MALCIAGGGATIKIASLAFMLSWTHSVQKTQWEEDWAVTPDGLRLTEARIESTGAGMEMPDTAKFDGRFWRWTPELAPLSALQLRRSEAVPEGYRLCTAQGCRRIAGIEETADIVTLAPCP